jgi:hypothetical protein
VLYLDRPLPGSGFEIGQGGRFGYSDLKGAALSGAADLWELNAGGMLVTGWVA